MCTMAIFVARIRVIAEEVPAVHVINEAVCRDVIVHTVAAAGLGLIHPDICGKILMVELRSAIDYCNYSSRRFDTRPRFRGIDVGVTGADDAPNFLSGIVEAPQEIGISIVGQFNRVVDVVGFNVEYVGIA